MFTVLDLACGTGSYLATQRKLFEPRGIRWCGVDSSREALEVARGRLSGVELAHGQAEAIPFPDATFGYVNTSFAFHRFNDQLATLDEIGRVLAPRGALRLYNLAPAFMKEWWLYDFFPEARLIDEERYWAPRRLHEALAARRFTSSIRVEYELGNVRLAELVEQVEQRSLSNLTLLRDADYERGKERLLEAFDNEPDGTLPAELALLTCTAVRG